MKIIITITLLFSGLLFNPVFAAVSPTSNGSQTAVFDLPKAKFTHIENITGKKLTLLQKIQFRILQKKLRKYDEGMTEKQEKQARWSMILGISSLVLLLIPVIGLLCLPAAILAIIFGIKSLEGNSNTKGIVGVVTGGVTLFLILLAIIFIAALFASF